MKRIFFIFSLLLCLLSVPVTGFAAETDEEQVKYEDATADNMKEMLKGSIALDKISAENKESLLNWLEAENKPEEAKKLVDKIQKLQEDQEKDQEKDQESMDPYTKAKKTCDKKLNAEGANAALENIIRIQKDRLEDQEEVKKLWKDVEKLLKK